MNRKGFFRGDDFIKGNLIERAKVGKVFDPGLDRQDLVCLFFFSLHLAVRVVEL